MSAPAIRTAYDGRYAQMDRIRIVGENTTFHRGFGTTGTRVCLMDASAIGGCPRCDEDEMVASLNLNPEGHDDMELYCTNISCPHFVGDEVEFDMNRIRADRPHKWDNSAECPDCGKRFTTELQRGSHERRHYVKGDADSGIVRETCDECKTEVEA